jgi:histidinol-phosphatase (PHP family)
MSAMPYPPDSHVHTEWSWDAQHGDMQASCARAVELGLPAIAFTEHVDHTVWTAEAPDVPPDHPVAVLSDPDGRITPPPFDSAGYLTGIDRCRSRFPGLRILTGLELGEPHRHPAQVARVLATGPYDRVLGSLHTLPEGNRFLEPPDLFRHRDPADVVRDYLLEVARLVAGSDAFAVLAHIDYPLRDRGPVDLAPFEDEFRYALRATARSGRVLEFNTVVPLDATVLRWWYEEGGEAVTFGSDAHDPDRIAAGFREAAALAEAVGFRPAADPIAPWPRD